MLYFCFIGMDNLSKGAPFPLIMAFQTLPKLPRSALKRVSLLHSMSQTKLIYIDLPGKQVTLMHLMCTNHQHLPHIDLHKKTLPKSPQFLPPALGNSVHLAI